MAGTKGRSGGARKNSGGARPGAGRPPKPPVLLNLPPAETPLVFLINVMNDPGADLRLRIDAAKAAAQYTHTKPGDAGVKDQKQEAAIKASTGKFGASRPPVRLVT